MRVLDHGPPDAPALVFLHGLIGSTAWWDPLLPAFRGWRVLRLDLLGHGGSTAPYNGYGVAAQADRVADALDRSGVSRAVVVGHSFGGLVATALAEQRPDLVSAVTVIGTPPTADSIPAERGISRVLAAPVIGPLVWRLRIKPLARAGLRASVGPRTVALDRIVADSLRVSRHTCVATYEAGFAYLAERPMPDRLADLHVPAQVIFGAREERRRPSKVQLYQRLPGVRVDVLAGAGHTPMFDDADATAALIHDFTRAAREVFLLVSVSGVTLEDPAHDTRP